MSKKRYAHPPTLAGTAYRCMRAGGEFVRRVWHNSSRPGLLNACWLCAKPQQKPPWHHEMDVER